MRKFLLFAVAAVICAFSSSAATDITLKVDIDNADAVELRVDDKTANTSRVLDANNGVNTYTVSIEQQHRMVFVVKPKSGFFIKTINDQSPWLQNGEATNYLYDWDTNPEYKIVTGSEADKYPNSATVTVDDATNLTCYFAGSYRDIALESGTQTIRFEDGDGDLYIGVNNISMKMYSITRNGDPVELDNSQRATFSISDGDNIVVTVNFPEVYCTVRVRLVNPDSEGVIDKAWIADEQVTDMSELLVADGFRMKVGDELQINFNLPEYYVNSVKVNNVDQPISMLVVRIAEDTEVVIDARRIPTITHTVHAAGTQYFSLLQGKTPFGIPVELNEGDTEISFLEDNSFFYFMAAPDCHFTEIRQGDRDLLSTAEGELVFDLVGEGDIYVVAEPIVKDKQFVFYVDDKSAASYLFQMFNKTDTPVQPENGFNLIEYYDAQLPYELRFFTESESIMYCNNEVFPSADEEGTDYPFIDPEGDVYRLYFRSNPEPFDFTITKAEGVEAEVTYELINKVADFPASVTMMPPTPLTVVAPEGKKLIVKLNDTEPVVTDKFETTVYKAGTLEISSAESGIGAIGADSAAPVYYDLQGRRVANPDKGIYIVRCGSETFKAVF